MVRMSPGSCFWIAFERGRVVDREFEGCERFASRDGSDTGILRANVRVGSTVDRVVVVAAVDDVVAGFAVQGVVAGTADDQVVAGSPADDVRELVADEDVIER